MPEDGIAILTLSMQRSYPGNAWNCVFGWSNTFEKTSVFNFLRPGPPLLDHDPEHSTLFNACHTLVHKIAHALGLAHCAHFECAMNGFNSCEEQNVIHRYKANTRYNCCVLCSQCLGKLQAAIGFKTRERAVGMQAVCEEMGFRDSAGYFAKVLKR